MAQCTSPERRRPGTPGVTFFEWNLAPPHRANTIIMTDANGRTVLDYAQAANHDKNTDWNVVGDGYSEITSGRELVNICDQAGLCLATLGEMFNRQLSLRCSLLATRSTTLLFFGQEALTRLKSKLATNLVRVFDSARSMTMYWFVSDSNVRDVMEPCCATLGNER